MQGRYLILICLVALVALSLIIAPRTLGTGTMSFHYGPGVGQWSNKMGDYLGIWSATSGCELRNKRDVPIRICAYTTAPGERALPPFVIEDTVEIGCSDCLPSNQEGFLRLPDVTCNNIVTMRTFTCTDGELPPRGALSRDLCESSYEVLCEK